MIAQGDFPDRATMHRLRSASHSSSFPRIAEVRVKLSRIVSRHEQLKIAFFHLNSQIRTGLLEAEDVFASLAIPLLTLVGLKTVEMEEEGRFSSIIMNDNKRTHPHFRDWFGAGIKSDEAFRRLVMKTKGTDEHHSIQKWKEENIMARATTAGKELMQKQKFQLMQLVHLLKQIEVQVNSSQDDILQNLADHRASIQKLFQKAVAYISAIHQASQTNGMSFITLKLLKCTFDHVGSALGSVESGVEDLMDKLAHKMCYPMSKYVNDLKAEMIAGACPSLMALVEEMRGAIRLRRMELEEARKKASAAEKGRLDMSTRLKESEERLSKMKEQKGFVLESNPISRTTEKSMKLLDVEEDQSKDEKLLWEILRKKRKLQTPDSPFGPKQLLGIGVDDRNLKSARVRPSISCKRTSRSNLKRLSPQTPKIDFGIPLGSSPSAASQQVLSRIFITP